MFVHVHVRLIYFTQDSMSYLQPAKRAAAEKSCLFLLSPELLPMTLVWLQDDRSPSICSTSTRLKFLERDLLSLRIYVPLTCGKPTLLQ